MATTEAGVREARADLSELLRRPRRSKFRRLREALSLCVWALSEVVGWIAHRASGVVESLRRADARVAATTSRLVEHRGERRARAARPVRPRPVRAAAPRPPSPARTEPATPLTSKFSRWTLHVTAVVLVAVPVAGEAVRPALGLVARPLVASLRSDGFSPLYQRSSIVAADGSTLAEIHDGVNRREVPLAEVPQVLRDAVIAAEDQHFWTHGGYDTEAIGRAAMANLRAGEVTQGASTITQQLAKQNHVGDSASLLRKGKELLYAVALEDTFSKEELLERYLNQVYFGSQAYGVAAAAEEFFATDLAELSVEQAALLAGLIRAPAALDPRSAPEAALARRNDVLSAMTALGHLPPAEAEAAKASPLEVAPHKPPAYVEPAVVEAAKREFLANPAFGESEEERRQLLFTGGLTIKVTVDPALQAAAKAAARWVPGRLGTAIVAVDPRTGRIAALSTAGEAADGHFDVATQGGRQPGSTFKPLVAAAALEAGMPEWQALVGDGPVEIDYQRGLGPWRVDNFDGYDYGLIGLREAVVDSVNTAFAQLGVALGADRIAAMAERLGINPVAALGPPETRGPSMALGGLTNGVSPLQLASAYSAFAANGVHTSPYIIDEVLGPDGSVLHKAAPTRRTALDPAVNADVVEILVDAVEEGTGEAAALPGWDVLGKTGTSEDSADAWFVGAVPTLSTAVWIGHPDRREPIPGLTGGTMAAPVWRAFMSAALKGARPVTFDEPDTSRPNVTPLRLPPTRPCSAAECTSTDD